MISIFEHGFAAHREAHVAAVSVSLVLSTHPRSEETPTHGEI
jgi:hypothetical protein